MTFHNWIHHKQAEKSHKETHIWQLPTLYRDHICHQTHKYEQDNLEIFISYPNGKRWETIPIVIGGKKKASVVIQ